MDYKLKSGAVVNDADICRMVEAIERGELPGEWSGEAVSGHLGAGSRSEVIDVIATTTRRAS